MGQIDGLFYGTTASELNMLLGHPFNKSVLFVCTAKS